jgi:hypothetical protein
MSMRETRMGRKKIQSSVYIREDQHKALEELRVSGHPTAVLLREAVDVVIEKNRGPTDVTYRDEERLAQRVLSRRPEWASVRERDNALRILATAVLAMAEEQSYQRSQRRQRSTALSHARDQIRALYQLAEQAVREPLPSGDTSPPDDEL